MTDNFRPVVYWSPALNAWTYDIHGSSGPVISGREFTGPTSAAIAANERIEAIRAIMGA